MEFVVGPFLETTKITATKTSMLTLCYMTFPISSSS